MRKELTIILTKVRGIHSIHFTSGKLQGRLEESGNLTGETWFPVTGTIFRTVENALVANGIANNVVSVEQIRECGPATDFRVVYNQFEGA